MSVISCEWKRKRRVANSLERHRGGGSISPHNCVALIEVNGDVVIVVIEHPLPVIDSSASASASEATVGPSPSEWSCGRRLDDEARVEVLNEGVVVHGRRGVFV